MSFRNAFKRSFFPGALVAFGLSWLVLGYLYDVVYAGIPVPDDAPIELRIQHDRNRLFLERIYLIGLSILALGLVSSFAQVVIRYLGGRDVRRPGPPPPS